MNSTVIMLALCQAMLMTTISLVLSSSALIGVQLSSPDLATVPLAIQYLATMLFLFPVSRLMEIHGRKKIFIAGAILGALGLGVAAAGIRLGNFILFATAGFLIGHSMPSASIIDLPQLKRCRLSARAKRFP